MICTCDPLKACADWCTVKDGESEPIYRPKDIDLATAQLRKFVAYPSLWATLKIIKNTHFWYQHKWNKW